MFSRVIVSTCSLDAISNRVQISRFELLVDTTLSNSRLAGRRPHVTVQAHELLERRSSLCLLEVAPFIGFFCAG